MTTFLPSFLCQSSFSSLVYQNYDSSALFVSLAPPFGFFGRIPRIPHTDRRFAGCSAFVVRDGNKKRRHSYRREHGAASGLLIDRESNGQFATLTPRATSRLTSSVFSRPTAATRDSLPIRDDGCWFHRETTVEKSSAAVLREGAKFEKVYLVLNIHRASERENERARVNSYLCVFPTARGKRDRARAHGPCARSLFSTSFGNFGYIIPRYMARSRG